MAFSNFTAQGQVREVEQGTTKSGLEYVRLLLCVGQWQGRNGSGEDMLEVTLWRDQREMASGVSRGDEVAVSGRLKSARSQQGYWNTRLSVQSLVRLSHAAQQQVPQQQGGYAPQQAAYDSEDIPF